MLPNDPPALLSPLGDPNGGFIGVTVGGSFEGLLPVAAAGIDWDVEV